ncbi:hypothetical protein F2P81_024736 [Scophthalmus maximus]|uniref:Uncharacterized protein n=1 Tax=Scophthalmus maximus TaxID=52904 RepID=A0A6A4RRI4_SCOMX|nr:hypothetical protein F2P81_024736 [Scophthalmus maximus]
MTDLKDPVSPRKKTGVTSSTPSPLVSCTGTFFKQKRTASRSVKRGTVPVPYDEAHHRLFFGVSELTRPPVSVQSHRPSERMQRTFVLVDSSSSSSLTLTPLLLFTHVLWDMFVLLCEPVEVYRRRRVRVTGSKTSDVSHSNMTKAEVQFIIHILLYDSCQTILKICNYACGDSSGCSDLQATVPFSLGHLIWNRKRSRDYHLRSNIQETVPSFSHFIYDGVSSSFIVSSASISVPRRQSRSSDWLESPCQTVDSSNINDDEPEWKSSLCFVWLHVEPEP